MNQTTATVRKWLAGPLPDDVSLAIDRLAKSDDVRHVAVMPDVHLSEEICTGTVLATSRLLYPHAVGNDIGCGMAAIRFDCDAAVLDDERAAAQLLAGLYRTVPAIRQPRSNLRQGLPITLASDALSHPRLEKRKLRDGLVEFATLGRGNHFIEFQGDDAGQLWLMIHSGSRAMGQAIHEHHLGNANHATTGLHWLDAERESGGIYLADLKWACRYAEASRQAMVERVGALVASLFGTSPDWKSFLSCNHNYVRKELFTGEEYWIHRKGAISAREGEPGIIPGSMGSASLHVSGRGNEDSLQSSSHGAGRCMSRSQAFRSISQREFSRQMRNVWFDHRLADKLRDEAPSAYKNIDAVMHAQRDLTRTIRKLHPLLCYKGI